MNTLFPALDPIPLPAPVWLFKGLHILTLSLHFIAVEMLLGGLLLAVVLNLLGRGGDGEVARCRRNAAAVIGRRLTVLMTYVINLGVPPLLFAQVLYGRALYTSSVLIGVYWISVVFLLMACYWLLYRFTARLDAGRSAWWVGLPAWLLAGGIAKILSTNMTLMLRPEVWPGMYAASGAGLHLPPYDPTLLPRWLFMIGGGLVVGGLWLVWISGRKTLDTGVRHYLCGLGGRLALVMSVVQVSLGWWVYQSQPEPVRAGLTVLPFYHLAGFAWLAVAALLAVMGGWAGFAKPATRAAGWVAALGAFLSLATMTIYRDGIRDVTLAGKGFHVWDQRVETNWSVLILFLVLFVIGLGALGWLISVMARSKPVSEKVA
ncbi:MAG: hypothetical protein ABSC03_03680 [Verrucomicrobiota bacterium]|jgi:hypothetical protein